MAKHLLIVESPAKAKTIERYLGSDYQVVASMGHIRDLPKGDKAIDIEAGFEPRYEVTPDKLEVVTKLRKLAKKVDKVWLATDEDREGEAISWHLLEALELELENTPRIVFNEITKTAIEKAIQAPRQIDMDLVYAQQARRLLDRLVGFNLSPILWKKVRTGLSAGRVQSVAVRLIVEREREVMHFEAAPFFQVAGQLQTQSGKAFPAKQPKHLNDAAQARAWLETATGARFTVGDVKVKPGKRTPAAPFTTSTLQQEASRKLGYGVAQTMRLAQGLYEAGHITYMRTDSVNLSSFALKSAEEAIKSKFGERYHKLRTYKGKTANAQEAHEAIRPTDLNRESVPGDRQAQKLYELIWKRTLASQMADAELERTTVDIRIEPQAPASAAVAGLLGLQAKGEVIVFDGFLKLYLEGTDDEEDTEDSGLLPALKVGEDVTPIRITATERFTRPPARFTEASLVKSLEEKGIGRPSTYAPTISTIQRREYVVREDREGVERPYQVLVLEQGTIEAKTLKEITGAERSKLFPTDLGMLVNDFLLAYFPEVIDYSFTAKLEQEFDEISHGNLGWRQLLEEFYPDFRKQVEKTVETAERVAGERVLGTDPKSGKPVIARLGRFGPLVQIGAPEDEEKKFASLLKGQHLETITFEEAMKLFDLPRIVGKFEDLPVKANVGRFGPYLQHDGKYVSIPKDYDLMTVTLEEAVELIQAKRKRDAERIIQTFDDGKIQVLNGRWGPFISYDGENVKIPKDQDPKALTLEDITALYEAHLKNPPKGKGRGKGKAKTTQAAATPAAKKPVAKKKAPAKKKPAAKKTATRKPPTKTKKDA